MGGYVPASFSPQITSNQITQIPPYDDQGISFKGYSKKIIAENQYQLFPQTRRIQLAFIDDNTTTSQLVTRIDVDKRFYCASVHVDAYSTNVNDTNVFIYDGSSTSSALRLILTISPGAQHFDIDLANSPREFLTPTIFFNFSQALGGVNDFVRISLIGWAE